jgi:hypothetical protein
MLFGGPGYVTLRTKGGFCVAPITLIAVCADCRHSVGGMGEWCLLKNSVWEKAWPRTSQKSCHAKMPMKHLLCIGCTEKRIGRKLTRADFDMRSVHNKPDDPRRQFPMSWRLRDRLASSPRNKNRNRTGKPRQDQRAALARSCPSRTN